MLALGVKPAHAPARAARVEGAARRPARGGTSGGPAPRAPPRGAPCRAFGGLFGKKRPAYPGSDKNPENVQPKCEVVQETDAFQLRLYAPFVAAAVEYEKRDEGFLLLGEYLGGANERGARLVFTQPVFVTVDPDAGTKTMAVYVPSVAPAAGGGFQDLGRAPAPEDAAVRLEVAGGSLVAAATLEGNVTPDAAEAARRRLVAALREAGVALTADAERAAFQVLQYGPVYSLKTRVNEVLVGVQV